MAETVFSNMNQCYYKSNEKIYTKNNKSCTISNTVSLFNASEFAKWMQEGFKDSPFKSFRELAKAVNSNPATISRLMNASPQTNTDNPSQPKPDLVERLALAFQRDVNEALILAGHAPRNGAVSKKPQSVAEFVKILRDMGFDIQFDANLENLNSEDLQELIDLIETNLMVKANRKKKAV